MVEVAVDSKVLHIGVFLKHLSPLRAAFTTRYLRRNSPEGCLRIWEMNLSGQAK
jgi:hypothetical protein